MDTPLLDQAGSLLACLAKQCSAPHGLGSMSSSVYDSAWLSMIRKPTTSDGVGAWLFPECFEFVLAQQLPSGAWESYATPIDGILNTAAGLLSLKKHLEEQPGHHDWLLRSRKAEAALNKILHSWDISSVDQVGFEILVVSLLGLLEKEEVHIDFSQFKPPKAVRDAKLAKLPPSTLYQTPSTLYHSLEAFIGYIDFDRIHPWRDVNGSMMGSPASTAVYLMNSSIWDDEAEAYLRNVLQRANSRPNHGGVPCAWPTTIFEVSWVITAFASTGLPIGDREKAVFSKLLKETLLAQEGLLGFAPGIYPDADDTAKGLEALHYLDQRGSIETLLQTYESSGHFITYPGERNASFSANCNVLILLLVREDRTHHLSQISKAAQFLTRQAFQGQVKEKWHLSELYWMMLVARAFELLFQHPDIALAVFDLAPILREENPMVSLHILTHILRVQKGNGSWEDVCEVTSYGILTLSSLAKLPWMQQLNKGKIIAAMALGKSFIHSNRSEWGKGRHLWVEKVTYSSDILSEAYCLAGAFVTIPFSVRPGHEAISGTRAFLVTDKLLTSMRRTGNLLARTPLFSRVEPFALHAAEMQACFAIQALQHQPLNIFPRSAKGKDKYLFIIPLALTACVGLHGFSVILSILYDMMLLSILNFHADEYMEGVVERYFGTELDSVRSIVQQLFAYIHPHTKGQTEEGAIIPGQGLGTLETSSNGHDSRWSNDDQCSHDQPSLQGVRTVLNNFITYILHHPAVLSSPGSLQAQLASELRTFLLAHIMHAEDNHRLRAQWCVHDSSNSNGNAKENHMTAASSGNLRIQYREPGRTFYHWVRSTSADHTSCPFSFIFFNCLVHAMSSRTDQTRYGILASARTTYLAEDACRHLASLCRMYNDLGSGARDAEECALNSVNFPEFSFRASKVQVTTTPRSAKDELLWIAEYERRGLDTAMDLLEQELGRNDVVESLRLFIDVTDLYGQIYVLEDVGTRTR